MKKIILIVSLMLAPFALANLAEARPTNENIQVSQQQIKKKPVKKKPVKKLQQIQIQQPQQVIINSVYDTGEETASQYWAKERESRRG